MEFIFGMFFGILISILALVIFYLYKRKINSTEKTSDTKEFVESSTEKFCVNCENCVPKGLYEFSAITKELYEPHCKATIKIYRKAVTGQLFWNMKSCDDLRNPLLSMINGKEFGLHCKTYKGAEK